MSFYLGSKKIGDSLCKKISKTGKIVEGSLTNLTQSDFSGVYFIGEYKFAYSNGLKSVDFHDEVYTIEDYAFESCENLDEVLNFCGSKIGMGAFNGCVNLKKIELKSYSVEINQIAFRGSSLTNEIVENIVNERAGQFGTGCFMECENLTKLNLTFNNCPDTINKSILENNTSYFISGIEVPENFFMSCINLEEVTLGPKVVKINNQVFSNCPKLKKLTIMAEFPPEIGSTGFVDNVYNHPLEVIYIPKGTINRYKNSYPFWNHFSDIFVEME